MRIEQMIELVGTDTSGKWMSTDKVKELSNMIVQECLAQLQPSNDRTVDANVAILKLRILNHFGLDE